MSNVLIIGLGLIGGSVALAVKEKNLFSKIIGYCQSEATAEYCLKHHIIDKLCTDLSESVLALQPKDLIVIATPVLSIYSILPICLQAKNGVVITDALSVKGLVLQIAQESMQEISPHLIPAHPIAGSEKSGPQHANSNLFKKKQIIISPHDNIDEQSFTLAKKFWEDIGGEIKVIEASIHDQIFAVVSHMPHVLAYTLVNNLYNNKLNVFDYTGAGFKDFTRIAASDPIMWHDVCMANKPALLKSLNSFSDELKKVSEAISNGDSDTILEVFHRAQQIKLQNS